MPAPTPLELRRNTVKGRLWTLAVADLTELNALTGLPYIEDDDATLAAFTSADIGRCVLVEDTGSGSPGLYYLSATTPTWQGILVGSSAAAPATASYLTLATNATLTAERVLTAGSGVTLTDAGAGTTLTVSITTAGITSAMLRDSAALSVIGRSANSTGVPADITAGTDGHILRRSGTTIGFGTIDASMLAAGTVATARLGSGTADSTTFLRGDSSWATPSSGGAPTNVQYVTLATDATLTVERVLTAGSGVTLTDAGAGSTITVSITTAGITSAMLRDSAALSVIGRSANSTGVPADIATSADGDVLRRSGTTLGFGTIVATAIGSGTIATARLGSGTADSTTFLRGDSSWATPSSSGAPADATYVTLTTNGTLTSERTLAVSAELTLTDAGAGSTATLSVTAAGITSAMLRDSAALSVIGRSANSTGVPADIAAGTDGHILRRSGTTLGFGTIDASMLAAGTVATARLGSGTADTTTFLRGDSSWATPAGTGAPADAQYLTLATNSTLTVERVLTAGSGVTFTDAGAGSTLTVAITTAGVTSAMLRDSAALSVIGRSANSTGVPADIATSADGDVLRRSGTTLGFGTIVATAIGSGTVATARLGSGTADTTTFLRGDSSWYDPITPIKKHLYGLGFITRP